MEATFSAICFKNWKSVQLEKRFRELSSFKTFYFPEIKTQHMDLFNYSISASVNTQGPIFIYCMYIWKTITPFLSEIFGLVTNLRWIDQQYMPSSLFIFCFSVYIIGEHICAPWIILTRLYPFIVPISHLSHVILHFFTIHRMLLPKFTYNPYSSLFRNSLSFVYKMGMSASQLLIHYVLFLAWLKEIHIPQITDIWLPTESSQKSI